MFSCSFILIVYLYISLLINTRCYIINDVAGKRWQGAEDMFRDFVIDNWFLTILVVLLVVLSALNPSKISIYPSLVDWNTILVLAGFMIITEVLKESGYFTAIAKKFIGMFKSERYVVMVLTLLVFFFSMFLTNDVALLMLVPFTLSIGRVADIDIVKVVSLQAIAANAGSSLTPIGNPQNMIIWRLWDVPFLGFIITMLPLAILLLVVLVLFVWFLFPPTPMVMLETKGSEEKTDKNMLVIGLILLVGFIVAVELNITLLAFPIVFLFLFYREIWKDIDYLLLFIFILIFIDFKLLAALPSVKTFLNSVIRGGKYVFWISLAVSQVVSNVPATVLLSSFVNNWKVLAYGVNVGGNGLIIASLASVIAMRIVKRKGAFLRFHFYSIPYLVITSVLASLLFFR